MIYYCWKYLHVWRPHFWGRRTLEEVIIMQIWHPCVVYNRNNTPREDCRPQTTILSQGSYSCCIPHRDVIFILLYRTKYKTQKGEKWQTQEILDKYSFVKKLQITITGMSNCCIVALECNRSLKRYNRRTFLITVWLRKSSENMKKWVYSMFHFLFQIKFVSENV